MAVKLKKCWYKIQNVLIIYIYLNKLNIYNISHIYRLFNNKI